MMETTSATVIPVATRGANTMVANAAADSARQPSRNHNGVEIFALADKASA